MALLVSTARHWPPSVRRGHRRVGPSCRQKRASKRVRHRDKLRAWVPDTVESRKLQALCEQRWKLVNQRVALTNRLTSLLTQYFPQALEWVGDLASGQACDFRTQWATLAAVQRARATTLRQFYRAHNCRKADVIEARLAAIASARPLTTDAAVIEPLSLSCRCRPTPPWCAPSSRRFGSSTHASRRFCRP